MSLVTDQTTTKNCSKCGEAFGCGMTSTTANCWCTDLQHVGPVSASDQDCLCPNCLAEAIAELSVAESHAAGGPIPQTSPEATLVEGEDYYLEGAAMVFTAAFLRRRGYCCESGCRHCPFDAK